MEDRLFPRSSLWAEQEVWWENDSTWSNNWVGGAWHRRSVVGFALSSPGTVEGSVVEK